MPFAPSGNLSTTLPEGGANLPRGRAALFCGMLSHFTLRRVLQLWLPGDAHSFIILQISIIPYGPQMSESDMRRTGDTGPPERVGLRRPIIQRILQQVGQRAKLVRNPGNPPPMSGPTIGSIAHYDPASMRTVPAFGLPGSASGQAESQLIESRSARLKCDASLERDSVGIKTPLTRLAHLFRRANQILIADATRVAISYIEIDPADEAGNMQRRLWMATTAFAVGIGNVLHSGSKKQFSFEARLLSQNCLLTAAFSIRTA